MAPLPADEFAAALRDLDPGERLAFVADLWAARGWETTVEGDRVVATRGDRTVDITVVAPSRFGRPSVPDVDVVVATRSDEDFADACRAAGVEYVAPEDLLARLLYGVDRERAESLFATHFGRPLTAADDGPYAGSASDRAADSRIPWRLVGAVGLLLLVGAAVAVPGTLPGLSLGGGDEPRETTPVTPVDVGTETPAPTTYPPGLSAGGIENVSALAAAHVDSVRGREYRWRVEAQGPPDAPGMGNLSAWNYTLRVERATVYHFDGTFVAREGSLSGTVTRLDIYAAGDVAYQRRVEASEAAYRQLPIETAGRAGTYAEDAGRLVERYLRTDSSRVVCTPDSPSGNCSSFLVIATGTPAAFDREVGGYRAEAAITASGRVLALHVQYLAPSAENGTATFVTFDFRYDRFGDVSISEPAWVDEARAATGETPTANGTVTPTADGTRTESATATATETGT